MSDAPAPVAEPVATPTSTDVTVETLARTIWGEARGDGIPGMEAVAAVIVNRARHPRWWGRDIYGVCTKSWQFSCWNANDPNLAKLLSVTPADPQFAEALVIAGRAVAGVLPDPTRGADSYYDASIPPPSWAATAVHTVDIGSQRFYRVELPPPEIPAAMRGIS